MSKIIKSALMPLLLGIYPPLFHYANNVVITLLSSFLRVLLYQSLLAIGVYAVFLSFYRHRADRASIAAFVFLIFFNIYGIVYSSLLKLDMLQIEHYSLLPLFLLMAIYSAWLATKLNDFFLSRVQNSLVLILTILIGFNVVRIIPYELAKAQKTTQATSTPTNHASSSDEIYPDIYYIVLDEFSGLEPMRQYWKYYDVDDFKRFLEVRGFFVAEQSHGLSEVTLYELATRLNYRDYPCCDEIQTYFAAIASNDVMRYLKTKGYTTVTFDESNTVFPTDLPMETDFNYSFAPESAPSSTLLDDFGILVINNTMLRVFSYIYEPFVAGPGLNTHKDMLYFTLDKMRSMDEVRSPKFVYVHLLLPHMPFMFDERGVVITSTYNSDWNDYLGNYIFSLNYAKKMVNNIFLQADPNNPPVIILQSDHGARNQIYYGNDETLLKDFPEEFKTWILYTLYVPGYDMSSLSQDINPLNTFPIIFNYLFDDNIPLH